MSMQEDLTALAVIKAKQDALAKDKAVIEERLITSLHRHEQKTVAAGDLKGTLVESTRISIDADKLKASLSAALWKKVTTQVLDKEKLEAHIVTKDIDANIVAAASTEKDVKPFVRVSGKVVLPDSEATKPAAKRRVKAPAAKPRA